MDVHLSNGAMRWAAFRVFGVNPGVGGPIDGLAEVGLGSTRYLERVVA